MDCNPNSGFETSMGVELADPPGELEAEALDLEKQMESTAEKMLELRDTQTILLVQPPNAASTTWRSTGCL
eukprot:6463063-Amphidinium_carterae.2